MNSVCWTLIDRDSYEVQEWRYHSIDYPDGKKLQITNILDIVSAICCIWVGLHFYYIIIIKLFKLDLKNLNFSLSVFHTVDIIISWHQYHCQSVNIVKNINGITNNCKPHLPIRHPIKRLLKDSEFCLSAYFLNIFKDIKFSFADGGSYVK